MTQTDLITVPIIVPNRCPGCKLDSKPVAWASNEPFFGEAYVFYVEDEQSSTEFDLSILLGWECDGVVFGTVVSSRRRDDGSFLEYISKEHVYIAMPGRTVRNMGPASATKWSCRYFQEGGAELFVRH